MMTKAEKIAMIKAHKGEVQVSMLLRDDTAYVRVYKNDLLEVLANAGNDQFNVDLHASGVLYIDNA